MAHVRDSDTSLWLHNKLGTSNDLWNGGSICSQFNQDVLRNIRECFIELQSQVKLKLLLSFLHIPRRNVEEWCVELEEILEVALLDSDQWVCMLAELLKGFPSSGLLNFSCQENAFTDVLNDLRRKVRVHCEQSLPPLECLYLNRTALVCVVGQPPNPTKHFALRQKPKSATLRAELLQKSTDAASNFKKNSSTPSCPIRCRGLIKPLNDATPLKGIPSRLSPAFRGGVGRGGSPLGGRTPSRIPPRTPAGRKDGGIKLLEIDEQPMGYGRDAKRRKKLPELEPSERRSGEKEGAVPAPSPSTPDYAAGLLTTSQITAPSIAATAPTFPPATPAPAAPPSLPPVVAAPPQPVILKQQAFVPAATEGVPDSPRPLTENTPTPATTPKTQLQVVQQQPQVHTLVQAPPHKKGLSLTKEQMQEAQDMFNKSNKVTRPEKALILGFIAGSRDNPCPHLGQIVTIMLSEGVEEKVAPDGTTQQVVVETHFQMNYATGEWKRVKKFRNTTTLQPQH